MTFKRKKKHKYSGFTIVEVVMYVLIMGILTAMVTTIILQVYRFQITVKDRAQLNEDLRVLTKSIRDDMYLGTSIQVDLDGDLIIGSSFSTPAQVRYYIQGGTAYRQEGSGVPVAITHAETDVRQLQFQDISTPSSAGVIRLTLQMYNYPRGPLKPEVSETVTSTISLKFL